MNKSLDLIRFPVQSFIIEVEEKMLRVSDYGRTKLIIEIASLFNNVRQC